MCSEILASRLDEIINVGLAVLIIVTVVGCIWVTIVCRIWE